MPLGNSLAFIKLHKTRFLGPFGIPTQTFTFLISPITISFSSKTKHQAKLSVTGQYYCRDQTVTERPVRPRVSAPTIMYIRTYVYLCHTPVTLIKSTYYSILIRILGTSYRTLLRSIVNNMANNLTRLTDHKYSGCNKRQYSEPTTILFNIWKINENF